MSLYTFTGGSTTVCVGHLGQKYINDQLLFDFDGYVSIILSRHSTGLFFCPPVKALGMSVCRVSKRKKAGI
jgi:hypothetical protein